MSKTLIDEYEYEIVPDYFRRKAITANRNQRNKQNLQAIDSPILKNLLAGSTVSIQLDDDYSEKTLPFRSLYNTMRARGFRLRMYRYDHSREMSNLLVMWLEPSKPGVFNA